MFQAAASKAEFGFSIKYFALLRARTAVKSLKFIFFLPFANIWSRIGEGKFSRPLVCFEIRLSIYYLSENIHQQITFGRITIEYFYKKKKKKWKKKVLVSKQTNKSNKPWCCT